LVGFDATSLCRVGAFQDGCAYTATAPPGPSLPAMPNCPDPIRPIGQPVLVPGSMGTTSYVLRGGWRPPTGRLARDPNRYLATVQIGITLAGFLAAAAVSLAEPLVSSLGILGSAAEAVAIVLVAAVLSFVTLVLGELAPKRIAMQRAERWRCWSPTPG